MTQTWQDVEFIVCNNASVDDTASVVQSFADPRIQLVGPAYRLSMRDNWEFALGHAKGQYVTFIGDDDALMPGGLDRLARLLSLSKVEAVKWQSPTYFWPTVQSNNAGTIDFTPGNAAAYIRSAAALNALRWGFLYYHFLPMIYHGAVAASTIERIKAKDGVFFGCEVPDIYSGIAAAGTTPEYLYVQTPITISGASRHSNGTSAMQSGSVQPGSPTAIFFSETKLGPHSEFISLADVPAIHASVFDALLWARGRVLDRKYYLPVWYRIFLIMRELSMRDGIDLRSLNHPLRAYAKSRNLNWVYDLYLKILPDRRLQKVDPGSASAWSKGTGRMIIDTNLFDVRDVYGASTFLAKLLSHIQPEQPRLKITTSALLWARLASKLSSHGLYRLFFPQ